MVYSTYHIKRFSLTGGIIISEKRKNNKGRILKTGESQRADLTYQYRYRDIRKKWRYVYAPTLEQLRVKEAVIQRDIDDGVDYSAGEITVLQLVRKYIDQKKESVRYNTQVGYEFVYNLIQKEDFGFRQIKNVKPSDAKSWFQKLSRDGRSYSTITHVRGVVSPAFAMAVEDSVLRNNPFSFRVKDVVKKASVEREALSAKEVDSLLEFIRADKCRRRYYDEIIILLETGLRISELYGLTIADIDFTNKRIRVERQLVRTRHCEYYIERPKTESGIRYVPMSSKAEAAFRNVIANRKKVDVEIMVDGHVGFLFLDKDGKPKVAGHLEHALKRIVDNYNASHETSISATPHSLRHTFCTNMVHAGFPIKELQYLMGHSDVQTTLNRYAHTHFEEAEEAFRKVQSSV